MVWFMNRSALVGIEHEAWFGVAGLTQIVSTEINRALQASSDLTLWEYQTLSMCREFAPHGVRIGQLAEAANVSIQHASKLVARLTKEGLLARHEDPADARAIMLRVTEQGHHRLAIADDIHADTFRTLLLDECTPLQITALAELGRKFRTGHPHTLKRK